MASVYAAMASSSRPAQTMTLHMLTLSPRVKKTGSSILRHNFGKW